MKLVSASEWFILQTWSHFPNLQCCQWPTLPHWWHHHANLFGKVQQQIIPGMLRRTSCSSTAAMCSLVITFKSKHLFFSFNILASLWKQTYSIFTLLWIHTAVLYTLSSKVKLWGQIQTYSTDPSLLLDERTASKKSWVSLQRSLHLLEVSSLPLLFGCSVLKVCVLIYNLVIF